MQKAFKFLDKHKIKYSFHDYKTEGITKDILKIWLKHFATNQIINTKSTTYKSLTEEEKASIGVKANAIKIILKNTSIIKRPLLELESEKYLLGFNEEEWIEQLKKIPVTL